jgi:hypothetical protein
MHGADGEGKVGEMLGVKVGRDGEGKFVDAGGEGGGEGGGDKEKRKLEDAGGGEVTGTDTDGRMEDFVDESCGDFYGAGMEGECCTTCDDVQRAYRRKGWSLKITSDSVQCASRMKKGSKKYKGLGLGPS